MTGQPWVDSKLWALLFLVPGFLAVLSCVIFFAVGHLSGWVTLTRRFRATGKFSGERWGWQSARFRGWCNYNNCLTVGANPDSLFLSVMIPFGLFHPAVLIPWREIEVETGKAFFGLCDSACFRIGSEERVTVKIYGRLVNRVRQAAGDGWPLYHIEQSQGV